MVVEHRSARDLLVRSVAPGQEKDLRAALINGDGKENLEAAALTDLGFHLDAPVVGPDDAMHRGKSEAPADELGREKGVEDALHRLRIHAGPRVAHLEERETSRRACLTEDETPQPGRFSSSTPVSTVIVPPSSPSDSDALTSRFITTWRSCDASVSTLGRSVASSKRRSAFLATDTEMMSRMSRITSDRSICCTRSRPRPA